MIEPCVNCVFSHCFVSAIGRPVKHKLWRLLCSALVRSICGCSLNPNEDAAVIKGYDTAVSWGQIYPAVTLGNEEAKLKTLLRASAESREMSSGR